MGRRLFWFAVGVGLTALIVVKGREYYERFTPKGVAEQIEKSRTGLVDWVGEFITTMNVVEDKKSFFRIFLTIKELSTDVDPGTLLAKQDEAFKLAMEPYPVFD